MEPLAPPRSIDQSAPPGTVDLTAPPGTLVPPAPLWSVVALTTPQTSRLLAVPHRSTLLALSGSSFPLAPHWSSVPQAPPQASSTLAPPRPCLDLQVLCCCPVLSSPRFCLGLQLSWMHRCQSGYPGSSSLRFCRGPSCWLCSQNCLLPLTFPHALQRRGGYVTKAAQLRVLQARATAL